MSLIEILFLPMITTTTCIVIASVATPLFGVAVVLIERYLRWCKRYDEDTPAYIELHTTNVKTNQNTPMKLPILNATFLEAAACNCPMLCSLLIQKGATEVDAALAIAIEHGHIDTCKAIISSAPCNLDKALSTAQDLKKYKIAIYINSILKNTS
jgi:hypothetical protein